MCIILITMPILTLMIPTDPGHHFHKPHLGHTVLEANVKVTQNSAKNDHKVFGVPNITDPRSSKSLLHMVKGDAAKSISLLAEKRCEYEYDLYQLHLEVEAKIAKEKERLARIGRDDKTGGCADDFNLSSKRPVPDLDGSVDEEPFQETLMKFLVDDHQARVYHQEVMAAGLSPTEKAHRRGQICHKVVDALRKTFTAEYYSAVSSQEAWAMRYMGIGLHRLTGSHFLNCFSTVLQLTEENSFLALCSNLDIGENVCRSVVEARGAIGFDLDEA